MNNLCTQPKRRRSHTPDQSFLKDTVQRKKWYSIFSSNVQGKNRRKNMEYFANYSILCRYFFLKFNFLNKVVFAVEYVKKLPQDLA